MIKTRVEDGVLFITGQVSAARPNSSSVRATIPETIRDKHNIKDGSSLTWAMDAKTGKIWIAEVDGKPVGKGK